MNLWQQRKNNLQRGGGGCGIVTPVLAFTCILAAIYSYPGFSWTNNALSDLGIIPGVTGPLFNFGLYSSGLLTFNFAVFGLFNYLGGRWVGGVGAGVFAAAGLALVPHVIVGLDDGRLKGELDALKTVASAKPSAIVIIAFMPIHGTEMAKVKPPTPADIAKVTATARLMFPKTPLVLGCVRPKGRHRAETDILALKAGVDAIAFPSEEAIKHAMQHGYTLSFSQFCCAQIYADAALNIL